MSLQCAELHHAHCTHSITVAVPLIQIRGFRADHRSPRIVTKTYSVTISRGVAWGLPASQIRNYKTYAYSGHIGCFAYVPHKPHIPNCHIWQNQYAVGIQNNNILVDGMLICFRHTDIFNPGGQSGDEAD